LTSPMGLVPVIFCLVWLSKIPTQSAGLDNFSTVQKVRYIVRYGWQD
jgi:hypothetical protein